MEEIRKLGINFENYLFGYKEEPKIDEILDTYENYLKTGESIIMQFTKVDKEGNLFFYNSNVEIRMDNIDIKGYELKGLNRMGSLLERPYNVKVVEVNREDKIVKVSHEAATAVDREKMISFMEEEISKEDGRCIVPAKIVVILQGLAILDIGGMGIPGYVWIRNWSKNFCTSIEEEASAGDIINVEVIGKDGMTESQKSHYFRKWTTRDSYECSRAATMADPWEGIEQTFKKGDIIRVRCRTIPEDASYFLGTIENNPGINILCWYVGRRAYVKKGDIAVGGLYDAEIRQVSAAEHKFKVDVLKRIQ